MDNPASHSGTQERRDRASAAKFGIVVLCGCLAACSEASDGKQQAGGKTLQYVLASFDYLFYQSPGAREECSAGFTPSTREQWQVAYANDAARKEQLGRCLAINNRGPNCENVWAAPEIAKDPLPYHVVTGKLSYGVNLDGTRDGRATAMTCSHEKFVDPRGVTGIDNQYYRFLGCERFVQGGQHHSPQIAKKRTIQYQSSRVLLEVSHVDDPKHDDDVEVTLYRGKDPLMADPSENAVPFQSQRIDPTIPPVHLHGKIVKGELVTEPADVIWEGVLFDRRQLIRGMSLRLKLAGNRATGLRVGYVDVDRLWQSFSRTAKWGGQIYGASGPSAYNAMYALADGYKDARTGQCTALSSAEGLDFVRAYIIRPKS
jgi:hypothetical protein